MWSLRPQAVPITHVLIAFSIFGASFGNAVAQNTATKTYKCTAKDAIAVQNDGTLNKTPGAEATRRGYDQMFITVPSGHVTYSTSLTTEVRTVQTEDFRNDIVLVPSFTFQFNKTAANAVTDFIRLHSESGQAQLTFTAFSLSYLVTGTCESVR